MDRRRYVVAYDIREAGRLRRVHKTMKGFGFAMQYSVFVCDLTFQEKLLLKEALGKAIHHGDDSVAIVDVGGATAYGSGAFEFMGKRRALPSPGPHIV